MLNYQRVTIVYPRCEKTSHRNFGDMKSAPDFVQDAETGAAVDTRATRPWISTSKTIGEQPQKAMV